MNRLLLIFFLLSSFALRAQHDFYKPYSERIAKGDTAGIRLQIAKLEKAHARDTASLALLRLLHAELFFEAGKSKEGITKAGDAIELAKKSRNDSVLGVCHAELGMFYYAQQENLPAALEHLNKGLSLLPPDLRDRRQREYRWALVLIHSYLANDRESFPHLDWLKRAAELAKDSLDIAAVLNNYGIINTKTGRYDSAEYYHSRALTLRMQTGNKKAIGQSYNNLGALHFEQEQYEKALDYYWQGYALRKAGNASEGAVIESMINIARAQRALGKKAEAIDMLEQSLERATNHMELRRRITEQLKELYFEKGDYKGAFRMQTEFYAIVDSLYGLQKRENVLRLIYEQHAREDSISRAQAELMAAAEREKDAAVAAEREKKILLSVIALGIGLLLLGAISFVLYRGNLRRKKDNAIISAQRDALETKQKEIGDSISYARRIQDALLPSQILLQQLFPAHFIFFRPRDVVSGDFYWAAQQDGKTFLAVADCTGHGVPGALMSMIGINFLNRIVKEKGLGDPGRILLELHEGIIATFSAQQSGSGMKDGASSEMTIKDGMDIALIVIDVKARTVSYAGAARPLLLADAQGLREIKPDRWSVGGVKTAEGPFTTTTMSIQSATQLYLFSDGFADQFGGGQGKKFKYAQLRSLLEKLQGKDPRAQLREIENAFSSWKGELEQVDDVLLIGVQV